MIKYTLLILISLILFGCANKEYFEYDHKDFVIDIPVFMSELEEKPADAICEFVSENKETELRIAIYQDTKESIEDEDYTLQDYYKFVANDLLDNTLESGSLSSSAQETINGLNVLIFEIDGKYSYEEELYNMFFLSAVYETDDCFYEVTAWTGKDSKDLHYDNMMMAIRSFTSNKE